MERFWLEIARRWHCRRLAQPHGITLIEILIGTVVSSIIMASMYQTYYFQYKSYIVQDQVVEMQQILRASMYLMANDIQMAGYDPTSAANAGFVVNLPSPNNGFGATTNNTIIAFTVDNDGDGVIEDNHSEQIAYRLNSGFLERFIAQEDTWRPVAEHIEALNFVYLDSSNTPTAVLDDIRSVEITLLARSRNPDAKFENTITYQNNQSQDIFTPAVKDHYRRRLLTTRIRCRNIEL